MNDIDDIRIDTLKDENFDLPRPIFRNGIFDNPWPTWRFPSLRNILRWRFFEVNHTGLPNNKKALDTSLPVRYVTEDDMDKFYSDASNKIRFLWIGHASCLLNIENCIVLIDPVFSERCSPIQLIGPKRFRPVPINFDCLRRLDAVIISHNHYDHLDYKTVTKINEKFGQQVVWFVGKGLENWFNSCGISSNVIQMNWWQSQEYKNIKFNFTIAQHWSGRGLTDRCKTLWGSWTLIGPNKRFFFAGDTGYCSSFTDIGEKYGPFDLSAIPIGAYEPRFMMQPQHVDPDEAVKIHIDIKSKKSIGVHWGTFALANEYYMEPKTKLSKALETYNLDKESFITIDHGEFYETEN